MQMGFQCKLYRNTGSFGTPTWTEFAHVGDATVAMELGEANATTRAAAGFGASEPALNNLSIDFEIKCDHADTGFLALRDAAFARTSLDIVALDGPILTVGSQGPRARWKIFKWDADQALEGIVTYSVTLKPCLDANPPSLMTIAGGG